MEVKINNEKKEITLINGSLHDIAVFLLDKQSKYYKNFKVLINDSK